MKLTLSLTSQTNKVYNMTNKYLDGWRRYDKVRPGPAWKCVDASVSAHIQAHQPPHPVSPLPRGQVTGLWNPKRKQQIEKLRPTCANLDSAMNYFQGIKVRLGWAGGRWQGQG